MKFGRYTQQLDEFIKEHGGIITTSQALDSGIPKDAFYDYVRTRGLEKSSHGVYLATDAFPDEFALLQARFPKAIFSHDSAFFLHGMSEREPIPLSVSVGSGYNSSALKGQGVRIYYVKPEWHELGICEVNTPEGNLVRAYNIERTICDFIRRRAKMDVTEFNYALRSYAASNGKNLARLSEYARVMNMESRVRDAMGVLL